MMTPVLTNGEATENMAIAAGKGPKAQKLGLKSRRRRWVRPHNDGRAEKPNALHLISRIICYLPSDA
jgi:hypothetical protein